MKGAKTYDDIMAVVLDELANMGYDRPKADSDISDWFSRCDKDDTATNAPLHRVDLFLIELRHRIDLNYTLGKSELINGDFATPDELVKKIMI
jgi:hypothetical protein